jgi:hypothetical protein
MGDLKRIQIILLIIVGIILMFYAIGKFERKVEEKVIESPTMPPAVPTKKASRKENSPVFASTPAKRSVKSPSIMVPKKTAHSPYCLIISSIFNYELHCT